MDVMRIGISAVLGMAATFGLVMLMYTLIDSGSKDLDEGPTIKIPDFLPVDRDVSENVKKTEVEKPEDPETPPPEIPEENLEFEIPDNVVSMAAPKVGGGMKVGLGAFSRDSDYIPVYVPQPQYPCLLYTSPSPRY